MLSVSLRCVPLLLLVCVAAFGQQQSADPYRVFPVAPPALRKQLDGLAQRYFAERQQAIAAITTPEQLVARQKYVRQTILNGFDGWPERTPLNAKITDTVQRDGYRIEKLIYQSLPGFFVTANVYVPEGPGPFPAVLGTAGHAKEGKGAPIYQEGWIGLVRRGFIVLAYDPFGQGERLQYVDEDTGESLVGMGTREHIMLGGLALLTGTNVAMYEIWDGIRAFDYLLTRSDVDGKRIAVVGNSGGGTQSAYLNALEPRLATASPSCYITSWRYLWDTPGPQDSEQVFVDFVKDGLDFADFLTAYAPRPVQMLAAIQDYFPITGAREAYAETRRLYGVMGAMDRTGFFEYDDKHGWSKPRREATYAWLEKWLQEREPTGAEAPGTPEDDKTLHVTANGQVLLSLGGRSLQQILRERAESVHAARKAATIPDADNQAFSTLVRDTLRILPADKEKMGDSRDPVPAVRPREGYRVEKLALGIPGAVSLPALLFRPQQPRGRAVVYLDDRGKAAEAGEKGLLGALAAAGHTVLAVDIRGIGEYGIAAEGRGYSPLYQDAMRALLVGTSLTGIQTADLLGALDAAESLPNWPRGNLTVIGKGNMGWIALFAAALDNRITAVASEEGLLSYMDILHSPRHYFTQDLIVPGILKAFDMPDLVARLNNRDVLLLNTRAPMEYLHSRETVRHIYTPASLAFLSAGREDALQIQKADEEQRAEAYLTWLKP